MATAGQRLGTLESSSSSVPDAALLALAADGFRVTVHEQHAVGTPLGSSPGPSRIFRTSYPDPGYVTRAARSRRLALTSSSWSERK